VCELLVGRTCLPEYCTFSQALGKGAPAGWDGVHGGWWSVDFVHIVLCHMTTNFVRVVYSIFWDCSYSHPF
jgi:hypothetical protein